MRGMMYNKITDCPHLPHGDVSEVWYAKEPHFGFGEDPDPKNLAATHVHLATLSRPDPESIFRLMQGENWSPNGEANQIIHTSGLQHTSMSVGDVVVVRENDLRNVFVCRNIGFELICQDTILA